MTIFLVDPSAKIAGASTRRFAREQAERLLGRLAFQIGRANKTPTPDTVHDLRVSIRRFSQSLRIFKPCFRGKELRKIRRDLKQIMTVAGEVRNHDIALKLLGKSKWPERAAWQSKIQNRRRDLQRSLLFLLKGWLDRKSSLKWRAALDRATARSRDDFNKAPIGKTARQVLPRMAQVFFKQGDAAAANKAAPRELHRFRIASKKFRYSLELFVPLYESAVSEKLEAIRRIQSLLGDVNDYETLRELVRSYQEAEPLIAWLKKRQSKRLTAFREYWEATFVGAAERQKWIDFLNQLAPEATAPKRRPARATVPGRAPAREAAAVA